MFHQLYKIVMVALLVSTVSASLINEKKTLLRNSKSQVGNCNWNDNHCGSHGYCKSRGLGIKSCSCDDGWGGYGCRSPQPCTAGANGQACQHSGTASGTTGTCGCSCAAGYEGANCECVDDVEVLIPLSGGNDNTATNLQACIGECDNDAQCAAGLKCFQRQHGESIPGCSGSGHAPNWDYCYDPNYDPNPDNTLTCNCEPGFDGDHCQNNIDDCAGVTCSDHGTCTDGIASRSCTCRAGYVGNNCEDCNTGWIMENSQCIEDTACHPSPCQNGGSCSVTGEENGFSCACTGDWIGDICDHKTCGQDYGCNYGPNMGRNPGPNNCATPRGGWAWPIHGWSSTNQRCCKVTAVSRPDSPWHNNCACPPGYRTAMYHQGAYRRDGCYATPEAKTAHATTWLGPQFWWIPEFANRYSGWTTPETTSPQPNAHIRL